jgi:DNA-directed RNA polymerase specialized sigma24 family protein
MTPGQESEVRRACAVAARRVLRARPSVPLDDLEAEALARVVLALPRHDPSRAPLFWWAMAVARNACLRYAEWWRTRGVTGLPAGLDSPGECDWAEVEARAEPPPVGPEEWESLLRGLTGRQRALALALWRDGRGASELVPEFGRTEAVVWTMTHKLRRRLAELRAH